MKKTEKLILTIGIIIFLIFGPNLVITLLEEFFSVTFKDSSQFINYFFGLILGVVSLLILLIIVTIIQEWWGWLNE